MTISIARFGYYISIAILILNLIFILCFVAIMLTQTIEPYTNLEEYTIFNNERNQAYKHIAQSVVILISICLLIILAATNFQDKDVKNFFSGLSVQFASISTTCLSIGYFIQFTAVKQSLENNSLHGLEHFLQFYPNSAIVAIIMLGYCLFMGLASFSILPSLSKLSFRHLLKLGFLINAISCLLGLIGYVFQIIPLMLVATNLGNGLGLILIGVGGVRYFKE